MELTCLSARFALEVMGVAAPAGFEFGNKALLPAAAFERIMRAELELGGLQAVVDDFGGAPGNIAAGGDVPSPSAAAGGGGFVFQISSPLRVLGYAGVLSFTSPRPDVIVLPQQVMHGLGVQDGAQVTVRKVRLPALTSVTLQPTQGHFAALDPMLGRSFLEESLVRFASLMVGDVISCDGGPANAEGTRAGAAVRTDPRPEANDGLGSDYDPRADLDPDLRSLPIEFLREAGLLPPSDSHSTAEPPAAAVIPAAGNSSDASAAEGNVYSFAVVALEPKGSPAAALWASFSSQVSFDLLPPADEFLVPIATPGAVAGPPSLRPEPPVEAAIPTQGLFSLPVGTASAASVPVPLTTAPVAQTQPAPAPQLSKEERRRLAAEAALRRQAITQPEPSSEQH
jgi:hypothetical protein